MVESVLVSASLLPLKLSPFHWGGLTSILPWNLKSESDFHRNNTRPMAHWALITVCGYSLFLQRLTWEQKPCVTTVHGSSCPDTFIHSFSHKVLDIFQVVLAGSLKKSPVSFTFLFSLLLRVVTFWKWSKWHHNHTLLLPDLCHIPWIIFL